MENILLLEFFSTFLNDLPNCKPLRKHKSYSQIKNLKYNNQFSTEKISFPKKYSQNFDKSSIPPIYNDTLPLIRDSTPEINKKISCCTKKDHSKPFSENIFIKN